MTHHVKIDKVSDQLFNNSKRKSSFKISYYSFYSFSNFKVIKGYKYIQDSIQKISVTTFKSETRINISNFCQSIKFNRIYQSNQSTVLAWDYSASLIEFIRWLTSIPHISINKHTDPKYKWTQIKATSINRPYISLKH